MKHELVPAHVIEDRLKAMRAFVDEHASIDGEEDRKVKMGRRLLAEIVDALEDAKETYLPVADVADSLRLNPQVVRRRAAAAAAGKPLPRGWEGLRVRRGSKGYELMVSTLPHRAA